METKTAIHSNLAIPPGEYLEEVIGALGMTKDELARRMSRPATKLSPIFKGDKAITPDTALQLEKVVGVPAHIWTGLEAEYRLTLARQQKNEEEHRLKSETSMVSKFCYKELVNLDIVAARRKPVEKVLELQRFFGVTSLNLVLEGRRFQAAFRCGKSGKGGRTPEAIAAWLRIGEKASQEMSCAPFDRTRLEKYLKDIRMMTLRDPKEFREPLQKYLAESGIAIVLCPHLPCTKAHGATFWLSKEKAVLMITIRCAWADIFWFSLFHELGHIMLHGRQAVILEDDSEAPEMKKREEEADRFAADILIPPDDYKDFVAKEDFHEENIHAFAHRIGVDSGIVVGRLQNDKRIKREWHNDLRKRYKWAKD
jgi:HTH-type transcriptional regulator/antitoxin HigA